MKHTIDLNRGNMNNLTIVVDDVVFSQITKQKCLLPTDIRIHIEKERWRSNVIIEAYIEQIPCDKLNSSSTWNSSSLNF